MSMNTITLYFVLNIIGVIVTVWVLLLQTEKKSKILIILILILVITNASKDLYNFFISRPKPNLIIDSIDQRFGKSNPLTSVVFDINTKNTGNAIATNVSTNQKIFFDNELFKDTTTYSFDYEIGQSRMTVVRFRGELFRRIWNEESQLTMHFLISFSDISGRKYYTYEYETKYIPHPNYLVPSSGWKITKTKSN